MKRHRVNFADFMDLEAAGHDSSLPAYQQMLQSLYFLQDLKNKEGKRYWNNEILASLYYSIISTDLAAAFTQERGIKFIVNGASIQDWGVTVNKLLTISDAVLIRDTRAFEAEVAVATCAIPRWSLFERSKLQPSSPVILQHISGGGGYWSSTVEKIDGVGEIGYILYFPTQFQKDVLDWVFDSGREFQKTGKAVYAPFIPHPSVELEFLKNGISISEQLGAESLWTNKIDFLDESAILALNAIQFPHLNGVRPDYLAQIREDYRDEFELFSNSIVGAITKIKSSAGDENFLKECRAIQRDIIDDNVNKISRRLRQISKMRWAGLAGVGVSSVGLYMAGISGSQLPSIITGISGIMAGTIATAAAEYKERFGAKDNPMRFIWRLRHK